MIAASPVSRACRTSPWSAAGLKSGAGSAFENSLPAAWAGAKTSDAGAEVDEASGQRRMIRACGMNEQGHEVVDLRRYFRNSRDLPPGRPGQRTQGEEPGRRSAVTAAHGAVLGLDAQSQVVASHIRMSDGTGIIRTAQRPSVAEPRG